MPFHGRHHAKYHASDYQVTFFRILWRLEWTHWIYICAHSVCLDWVVGSLQIQLQNLCATSYEPKTGGSIVSLYLHRLLSDGVDHRMQWSAHAVICLLYCRGVDPMMWEFSCCAAISPVLRWIVDIMSWHNLLTWIYWHTLLTHNLLTQSLMT